MSDKYVSQLESKASVEIQILTDFYLSNIESKSLTIKLTNNTDTIRTIRLGWCIIYLVGTTCGNVSREGLPMRVQ